MMCLIGSLFRFYFETQESRLHLFFMPTDGVVGQMVNLKGVVDVSYSGAQFKLCGSPVVVRRGKHDAFTGMTGVTWDAVCESDPGWVARDLPRDRPRGVILTFSNGNEYQLIAANENDFQRWERMKAAAEAA